MIKEKVRTDITIGELMEKLNLSIVVAVAVGFFISRVTMSYKLSSAAIAYLALFMFRGTGYYGVLISVTLGLISIYDRTDMLKYLSVIAFMTVCNLLLKERKPSVAIQAIIAGIAVLVSGIIISLINGVSSYYIFMSILEMILVSALIFVFEKAISRLLSPINKGYYSNEELISLCILIGGTVMGVGKIAIAEIYAAKVLTFVIIMILGYRGGIVAGVSSAVTLGIFMVLSSSISSNEAIIISCAGLICGLMREMGKLVGGIGFLMGVFLMSFYLNKGVDDRLLYVTAIIAFLVYMAIPAVYYERLKTIINFDEKAEDKAYIFKVQSIANERLKGFSHAFEKLAQTFDSLSEIRTNLSQKEIARLFDDVAAKVCDGCGMKVYCWESSFYDTYQTMFGILAAAEKKGHIGKEDIPNSFIHKCVNVELFVEVTNRMFEIYKNNLLWSNKIIESRKLISEQLRGVSTIIGNLSNEINLQLDFKEELERSIKLELNKVKPIVNKVVVVESKQGKYSVSLMCKPCYGKKNCTKEIIPLVNRLLKKKMKAKCHGCNISKEKRLCMLDLIEEEKYKIITGIARELKKDSTLSGDSHSLMEIGQGQFLMALSDGMGSGKRANRESTASIELLEEFLESGFDKDISIKLINSVLVLKSGDESFSTLDMCVADMYTGLAEFVKIGAAATYIKRDKAVEVIRSTSLPAGMFTNVDMEVTKRKLKDNDLIVMVTDGVIDCVDSSALKEKWIEKILLEYKGVNPQDIAEYLLQNAKELSKGTIQDDMTVIVAKLWERK